MLAPTIAPIHRRGRIPYPPVQVSGALHRPGGRQGRRPLQLYGKYTTTFLKVRPHKGDYQYAKHNF